MKLDGPKSAIFILGSLVLAVACSPKPSPSPESPEEQSPENNAVEKQSDNTKASLVLPLGFEDPAFAANWKQSLAKIAMTEEAGFLALGSLSVRTQAVPSAWRAPTEDWLAETGSIYRLGLGAGPSIQDARLWTRILQELQTLFETPQPQPPFRSSLQLFSAFGETTGRTRLAALDRYLEVQPTPQASPLAREACEAFRKWFSARQLLAGRTIKAFNRNKDPVVLSCSLIAWNLAPASLPFLQVAELALPLRIPGQRELLFKSSADLIRGEKLQNLLEMN